MSGRKGVNLTKLKQKVDDRKQGTISKFFSMKCQDVSVTTDVIEIRDDSPIKDQASTSKKRPCNDEDMKNVSKRQCVTEIRWDSSSSSTDTKSNGAYFDEQQPCSSMSSLSDTTMLKLKQFECGQEGERAAINHRPLKNNNISSKSPDLYSQSADHQMSSDDDSDDVIIEESPFSKFSRKSKNVTSVKGKSPLNKETKTKYTPLEQQYLDIKNKYPDALLLVECGYRYRMFGDDAENAAKVLKIFCHPDHNFQTASIPIHRLFVHVRRLVSAGYKVGVVKQTETAALKAAGDNKSAPFSRELHSLYTKSTLIGEDVNPLSGGITGDVNIDEQTSFLLSICEAPQDKNKETCIGMLAVQPSTGDIIYDCFNDNEMRSELETRITHIQPAEILVPNNLSERTEKSLKGIIEISTTDDDRIRLEKQTDEHFDYDQAFKNISEFFKSDIKCANRLQEIINLPKPVISCFSGVLVFLRDFGLSSVLRLTSNICQFSTKSLHMQLQSSVLRNLEVFQNLTNGKEKGSLFWSINQTTTKFGARMLKSWLKNPLLLARQILARQAAVHELIEGDYHQVLCQLKTSLSQTPDLEKGISSIFYKKCSVLEFFLVCKSLVKWSEDIKAVSKQLDGSLSSDILQEILTEVPDLLAGVKSLLNNICEDSVRDKDKTHLFSDESLFPDVQQRKKEIEDVQKEMLEHRRTVRLTLKQPALDYVSVMGTEYLVEVKNKILHVVPKDWFKVSSTKAVSRFHPPFIKATYKRLNQLREQLKKDCEDAWLHFLGWFEDDYQKYRKSVHLIATLDCLFSLASVARLHGYCRPTIKETEVCLNIEKGRHPVIQQILHGDQQFVPNDTHLSSDGKKVMIITGPNMGGKSSYIKQVALISILTQIGSYVPAESAEMGILDAIYTRMGASDEIYKGRSTFMVELSEASDIMLKATPRSLVILDELGRGTSTHDGVAIAYATLDYFINNIGCLTLFVTHYTMLSELENKYPDILQNLHMSFMVNKDGTNLDDSSDAVTFLYQLVSGCAGKSYGLNVARLASIPQDIISKAAIKSQELQDILQKKRERISSFKKLFTEEG